MQITEPEGKGYTQVLKLLFDRIPEIIIHHGLVAPLRRILCNPRLRGLFRARGRTGEFDDRFRNLKYGYRPETRRPFYNALIKHVSHFFPSYSVEALVALVVIQIDSCMLATAARAGLSRFLHLLRRPLRGTSRAASTHARIFQFSLYRY